MVDIRELDQFSHVEQEYGYERGVQSEENVYQVLKQSFTFIDYIRKTERFSDEDIEGIDLILYLNRRTFALLGFSQISVQVKSSQSFIKQFFKKGVHFKRQGKFDWIERKLVILNGQESEEFIVADFLIQVINLLKALNGERLIPDFLQLIDQDLIDNYVQLSRTNLYQELRQEIINWILTQ